MIREADDIHANIQLLQHFKYSSKEMLEIIQKERSGLKSHVDTRNKSVERICLRNAGLEGNIDEFYENIGKELKDCEDSYQKFIDMINERIEQISKSHSQDNYLFNEEVSSHVNLVSSLSLVIQKIEDFKNQGQENHFNK